MLGVADDTVDDVRQVSYVVDHLADLESDFSAVHGVSDMYALPGPRFLRMAVRLVAYPGVMQARAQGLIDAAELADATGQVYQPAPRVNAQGEREVEATREALTAHPTFSGLIDIEGG